MSLITRSILATSVATICFGGTPVTADLTTDINNLISANVSGGVRGFRLKRGDGVVLANQNSNYAAYPASCIKVAIHLHAMRVVETPNAINLNTMVPVYLVGNESCDDNHIGDLPSWEPLDDVLRDMMEDSDNDRTNAAIDFFGLGNINNTMHNIVNMSASTQIFNKFGSPCGGVDQAPANAFTLSDLHRIYENVANGSLFAQNSTRDDFYDLMLNSSSWLDELIDEEAPATMDAGDLADFKDGVELARKGGSWNTNDGRLYRTLAGWVKFPGSPCPGGSDEHYAFSVFIDEALWIANGFGTKTVVEEMLRDEVRAALEAYDAPCPPCIGDLNFDNQVDFNDVLGVLTNWGDECHSAPCDEDIDGSGVIDFGDLLRILGNWGPCL